MDDFEGRLEDDYSRVRMREAGLGTGRVVILEAHADAPIPHIVRQYVIQGGGTFCFAGFTVEGDDLSGFSPLLDRIVETLSSPA